MRRPVATIGPHRQVIIWSVPASGKPMRCSKCNAENPEGKRFCADCGGALGTRCPACGADSPVGKRFCGNCGAKLSLDGGGAEPPATPRASGGIQTPVAPAA